MMLVYPRDNILLLCLLVLSRLRRLGWRWRLGCSKSIANSMYSNVTNSYIPQTELHESKVKAVLSGNMLPSQSGAATSIVSFTHFTLCYSSSKIWLLSNIQKNGDEKLVYYWNRWFSVCDAAMLCTHSLWSIGQKFSWFKFWGLKMCFQDKRCNVKSGKEHHVIPV